MRSPGICPHCATPQSDAAATDDGRLYEYFLGGMQAPVHPKCHAHRLQRRPRHAGVGHDMFRLANGLMEGRSTGLGPILRMRVRG